MRLSPSRSRNVAIGLTDITSKPNGTVTKQYAPSFKTGCIERSSSARSAIALVPEMTAPREDHRQAVFIGRGNHFSVLHRPAWLHDGRGTGRGDRIETITKREERVRCGDRSFERRRGTALPSTGLADGNLDRVDPAHLPRPNRQRANGVGENHGVRLHV